MSVDLAADIRALAELWRGADHTRQCNARYGMGGCTCGFDARLDMAITAVINHGDRPSPTKKEIEEALAREWHKRGGLPAVETGMVNMVGYLADCIISLRTPSTPDTLGEKP